MKLISNFRKFAGMTRSRQIQWLMFKHDRLLTATIRGRRLQRCGTKTIVQAPLFWTPEYIELGSQVFIWSGARIEGIDEHAGVRYAPNIIIGNGVSIHQNCHITAANTLIIGENTTVLLNVVITDIDHGYEMLGVSVQHQPLSVRQTRIGRNCFIGAGARILAGTIMGNQCIIGTNSVVRGIFPDNCVVTGNPAKISKRLDIITGQWRKANAEGNFLE